ncbi:flagellar biosynthetic protein FliO [Cellulomonas sp. NS3]|uniref:flagellar biosynthetic protein FliO n=1 Tax=Cellulomonas sp. NS3 TaxID=2973977 RepID=UPI002161E88A|nr:flagellar biosynthetic protein FliO [Cellulomonas sp. NS3]
MDDGPVLLLRVVVSLLCVVGLIWVVARKVGATPGRRLPAGPSLQVVGRQSLGRHAGVAVLAVGNRRLLLGYGEQQVTMLTELAPVLDTTPAPAREVATRPAGTALTALPASLTSFVAARRPGRPSAAPAAADVPVAPAGDEVLLRAPLDIDALLAEAGVPGTAVPGTAVHGTAVHDTAVHDTAVHDTAVHDTAPHDDATPAGPAAPVATAPLVPTQATTSALDGSILSPATWRRAVTSLQERTVRR